MLLVTVGPVLSKALLIVLLVWVAKTIALPIVIVRVLVDLLLY